MSYIVLKMQKLPVLNLGVTGDDDFCLLELGSSRRSVGEREGITAAVKIKQISPERST